MNGGSQLLYWLGQLPVSRSGDERSPHDTPFEFNDDRDFPLPRLTEGFCSYGCIRILPSRTLLVAKVLWWPITHYLYPFLLISPPENHFGKSFFWFNHQMWIYISRPPFFVVPPCAIMSQSHHHAAEWAKDMSEKKMTITEVNSAAGVCQRRWEMDAFEHWFLPNGTVHRRKYSDSD